MVKFYVVFAKDSNYYHNIKEFKIRPNDVVWFYTKDLRSGREKTDELFGSKRTNASIFTESDINHAVKQGGRRLIDINTLLL